MTGPRALAPTSPLRAAQVSLVWGTCGILGGLAIAPAPLGVGLGLGAFLAWRLGVVRRVVLRHHHAGMAALRAGEPARAAAAFARSAAYFEARPWLDAGRGLLLGSAARWSYAHAGRSNEATSRALCGDVDAARRLATAVLAADPSMRPARALLDQLGAEPAFSQDWGGLLDASAIP